VFLLMDSILLKEMSWPSMITRPIIFVLFVFYICNFKMKTYKTSLASFAGSRLRVSRNSSHSVYFGLSSNGSMLVEANADLVSFLLSG
jgi:hypothetical protein